MHLKRWDDVVQCVFVCVCADACATQAPSETEWLEFAENRERWHTHKALFVQRVFRRHQIRQPAPGRLMYQYSEEVDAETSTEIVCSRLGASILRSTSGEICPEIGQTRSTSGQQRPNLAKLGQIWPGLRQPSGHPLAARGQAVEVCIHQKCAIVVASGSP